MARYFVRGVDRSPDPSGWAVFDEEKPGCFGAMLGIHASSKRVSPIFDERQQAELWLEEHP